MNFIKAIRGKRYFGRGIFVPIFLAIFCMLTVFNYVNFTVDARAPFSVDENDALFFSKQLAEKGTFVWHSDLNEKYDVDFFRPIHIKPLGNYNYTSRKPFGYIILLAIARRLHIINFVSSIIAALGIIGVYLLSKEIFNEKVAIFSGIILSVFPAYIFMANSHFNNLPPAVLAIFSLYFFIKTIKSGRNYLIYAFLCGLFLGIAITQRTPYVLLILPYIVVSLVFLFKRKIVWIDLLMGILGGAIPVVFLLVLNSRVYGKALASGHEIESVFPFKIVFGNYWHSFYDYLFSYSPLIFFFGILGLLFHFWSKKNRYFDLIVVATSAILFLFYGRSAGGWGGDYPIVTGSMARYFLLTYIFLIIYTAYFLAEVVWSKKFGKPYALIIVFFILITSLRFVFAPVGSSLIDYRNVTDDFASLKKIAENSPKNSIFITKDLDRAVFPVRQTLVYYTLYDYNKAGGVPYFFQSMEPVNSKEELVPMVETLRNDGFKVYVTQEASDLVSELKKAGYALKGMGRQSVRVYEVE